MNGRVVPMRKGNISGDKREIEIEIQTYSERKDSPEKRERISKEFCWGYKAMDKNQSFT